MKTYTKNPIVVKRLEGLAPFDYEHVDRKTKIKTIRHCHPLSTIEITDQQLWSLLDQARENQQDECTFYDEQSETEGTYDLDLPDTLDTVIAYFDQNQLWEDLRDKETMEHVEDWIQDILEDHILDFCVTHEHLPDWVHEVKDRFAHKEAPVFEDLPF